MEDDGTTYGFDLHAESASLAAAPWQWHFALSGPARAALTMDGELQHLASSEPLAGHIEVNVSQLDIGVVTSLLPLPAAVQLHGHVPNANVRLMFAGTQGITIAAGLQFQQLHGRRVASRLRLGSSVSRYTCKGSGRRTSGHATP